MLKKVLKVIAIVLLAALLVVGGYVAYVFISYHRLPDMDDATGTPDEAAKAGRTYAIAT